MGESSRSAASTSRTNPPPHSASASKSVNVDDNELNDGVEEEYRELECSMVSEEGMEAARHPAVRAHCHELVWLYGWASMTARRIVSLALYPFSADGEASESFEWFVTLFRQVPEYSSFWTDTLDEDPDTPKIGSTGRQTLLDFAITATHSVFGRKICGFEIVLAVAFTINPQLAGVVEDNYSTGSPLDPACLDNVSLGNPRHSLSSGVYLLMAKSLKVIVGYTFILGFQGRVGHNVYSKTKRCVREFGPVEGSGVDQRLDRSDYILFDLEELVGQLANLAWLAHAMETCGIVMFLSTDPARGMNTRATDPPNYRRLGGYTATQCLMLWRGVKTLTDAGNRLPPWGRSTSGGERFLEWYNRHLKGKYIAYNAHPEWIYNLIRRVSALADTGLYPSFLALVDGAWIIDRPQLLGNLAGTRRIAFEQPEFSDKRARRDPRYIESVRQQLLQKFDGDKAWDLLVKRKGPVEFGTGIVVAKSYDKGALSKVKEVEKYHEEKRKRERDE